MGKSTSIFTGLMFTIVVLATSHFSFSPAPSPLKFPWRESGLTEREAAAHLIYRFTYGATPGMVDEVLNAGMEKWFSAQLKSEFGDDSLNLRLRSLDAISLSNKEILQQFPRRPQILAMAIRDGVIKKESVGKSDRENYQKILRSYMEEKSLRTERELVRQFVSQKIWRAVYTQNQLQEVMTDFWFNHFNVSFTKNDCASFIPSYERDVIRPNALGKFESLLLATAKSPAMLFYLDNFNSSSEAPQRDQSQIIMTDTSAMDSDLPRPGRKRGLNENYAREVMELHTLGVEGGYTQSDVTEAARILTGWTVYPFRERYAQTHNRILSLDENTLRKRGFVHDGDFLFVANRHDFQIKTVLGRKFQAGRGYDEGVEFLEMLARHPSTAHFISRKIAIRFVNDNPSEALVQRMAATFLKEKGDIRKVLLTMVSSREFWDASAVRQKIKSPFELVISSLRSMGAVVDDPFPLFNAIKRMGQPLYSYQAPTGFPDRGQYWINTGSLLNRMNFGLAIANQKIPGTRFDLLALNKHHEPESSEEALRLYCQILMPGRDTEETTRRVIPLLNDPALQQKVKHAADAISQEKMEADSLAIETMSSASVGENNNKKTGTYSLAQVVGILLGSPEFQRR